MGTERGIGASPPPISKFASVLVPAFCTKAENPALAPGSPLEAREEYSGSALPSINLWRPVGGWRGGRVFLVPSGSEALSPAAEPPACCPPRAASAGPPRQAEEIGIDASRRHRRPRAAAPGRSGGLPPETARALESSGGPAERAEVKGPGDVAEDLRMEWGRRWTAAASCEVAWPIESRVTRRMGCRCRDPWARDRS